MSCIFAITANMLNNALIYKEDILQRRAMLLPDLEKYYFLTPDRFTGYILNLIVIQVV